MPYRAFIARYKGEKNPFLKFAPEFYSTFPHDNQIDIELPVRVLARNTFLDLMKDIVASRNRNVLIVAHGSDEHPKGDTLESGGEAHGLNLDIGTRKKIWTFQIMFYMLLYKKITKFFNEPGTKNNPEKLLGVIRLIRNYSISTPDKTKTEMVSLDKPASHPVYEREKMNIMRYKRLPDKTEEEIQAKEKNRRELVKGYLKYIKQEIKRIEKMFKSKKILMDHLKAITDIQRLKLNNIAIRGCNIGRDKNLLEVYRLFFNAQSINAPKVKIKYGKAKVNLRGRQRILNRDMKRAARMFLGNKIDPENWVGGASVALKGPKDPKQISGIYYHPQVLERNKDELLLTIRSSTIYMVAEHIDVVLDFTTRKFGPLAPGFNNTFRRNGKSRQFEVPICCLEQYPLAFPRDPTFLQSLENNTGAVR